MSIVGGTSNRNRKPSALMETTLDDGRFRLVVPILALVDILR